MVKGQLFLFSGNVLVIFIFLISSSYKTTLGYLHYCYEERSNEDLTDTGVSSKSKGDETYHFFKWLLVILKSKMAALIETDIWTANIFDEQQLQPFD